MAKQFDAASKHIIETYPRDWLTLGGLPADGAIEIADTDLSIVSTAADKLIRVMGPHPFAAHIEFQASADLGLDERVVVYNVLGRRRFQMPVWSIVFLLRPEALPGVTGRVSSSFGSEHRLEFAYRVVRVWEIRPEQLLQGGLGTLPLAPISAAGVNEVPAVIETMKRRLDSELPPQEAREVWVATRILMGLRYSDEMIQQLVQGVYGMEESTTYQAIIEQGRRKGIETGRAIEVRKILILAGARQFGQPDSAEYANLNAINDVERLETLMSRVLDGNAKSWGELLS